MNGSVQPERKIIDGRSTEWTGKHIRFSEDYLSEEEPKMWHCGTGGKREGLENYVYCQKEKCAIIGFYEKEPEVTKGGNPAWKQARSFIREVQLNDKLFLHNSSRGVEGGKGFVTHQGFFTGDITTNDPEVLKSEVKRERRK